jgi:hypothetical protein
MINWIAIWVLMALSAGVTHALDNRRAVMNPIFWILLFFAGFGVLVATRFDNALTNSYEPQWDLALPYLAALAGGPLLVIVAELIVEGIDAYRSPAAILATPVHERPLDRVMPEIRKAFPGFQIYDEQGQIIVRPKTNHRLAA